MAKAKSEAKEIKTETHEPIKEEKSIVPDPLTVDIKASSSNQVSVTESDEVCFLRRIYKIQNDGGFGTQLNKEINDRIEFLKKK